MGKYDIDSVIQSLERNGVKMNRANKTADAERLNVVGLRILGKLDFLNSSNGYTVYLPEIEYSPSKGYRGLKRPCVERKK